MFFAHGDKGDEPLLVSFDQGGDLLGQHLVTDANNDDWEDIAAAPCPDHGDCLYVGDIGDNDGQRAEITVYVVREPSENDDRIGSIARWVGAYPDGPHDAETLLVHPCTGIVYVVTKESDGISGVYKFPEQAPRDAVTLTKVSNIDVYEPGLLEESQEVTGGDWDRDGERVVLRTSDRFHLWQTDPDAADAHWLDVPQVLEGTNHPLGEGVAFDDRGAIWAIGEGTPIPVDHYACVDLTEAAARCEFPQPGLGCGCAGAPAPAGGAVLLGAAVVTARRRRARS